MEIRQSEVLFFSGLHSEFEIKVARSKEIHCLWVGAGQASGELKGKMVVKMPLLATNQDVETRKRDGWRANTR